MPGVNGVVNMILSVCPAILELVNLSNLSLASHANYSSHSTTFPHQAFTSLDIDTNQHD